MEAKSNCSANALLITMGLTAPPKLRNRGKKMNLTNVDSDRIAEGVYGLLTRWRFVLSVGIQTSAEHEAHAIAIIMDLLNDRQVAWDSASPPARQTAAALLVDFMAKLMGPPPVGWADRVWRVPFGDAQMQAKYAIAAEIERSHPQQSRTQ